MGLAGTFRYVASTAFVMMSGVAIAQQANNSVEFAALAIENQKKTAYGWSFDHPSQDAAEAEALSQCKRGAGSRNCEIVLAWSGPMCGSYFTHKKGLVNGWGVARTKAEAEGIAMNEFYARGPFEFADLTVYACNSTPRGAAKVLVNKPNTPPNPPLVMQNDGWITSLQISKDGKTVYSSDRAGNVRAWDTATGKQLRTYTGAKLPRAGIALSPDGKRLVATSSEKNLVAWDAATGRMLYDAQHKRWLNHATFSQDGRTLYAIGDADHSKTPAWPVLAEIDAATGNLRKETEFELPSSSITQLLMVGNESQFITASTNPSLGLNLWDRASGKKVSVLAAQAAREAALVNGGKTLVYVPVKGNSVIALDLSSGQQTGSFGTGGSPYAILPDASGQRVYILEVGSAFGKWDASGNSAFRMSGYKGQRLSHLVAAKNGKILASGAEDGTVRLWHAETGAPLPATSTKR